MVAELLGGGADAGVSLAAQFNTSAGDLASAFLSFMYSRCVLYPPTAAPRLFHPSRAHNNPIQPNTPRDVDRLRRHVFHPVPLQAHQRLQWRTTGEEQNPDASWPHSPRSQWRWCLRVVWATASSESQGLAGDGHPNETPRRVVKPVGFE